ncbi:MAG: hypothetical protein ABS917_11185 [Solibacillus sp.]|uniref:hypothetical protein n=1 Tax=Solibacillus sp. TaxID=1909654 RepID=UPI003315D45C
MKKHFLKQKEVGIIALILSIIELLFKLEKKWINDKGWRGLLLARASSILTLLFVLYITHFLFVYFGTIVATLITNSNQINNEYWWTIPTILGIPLITFIMFNFTNRNFILSEKFKNLLEIFNYSTKSKAIRLEIRIPLEITFSLIFVLIYSTVIFMSMGNFIDESTLLNWLENKSTTFILSTFSIVVYITIRILLIGEDSPTQKFIKNRRLFCLWMVAGIITLSFLIGDLYDLKEKFSTEFLYAGIVLLLAIDKIIDSYQKLRKVINENNS